MYLIITSMVYLRQTRHSSRNKRLFSKQQIAIKQSIANREIRGPSRVWSGHKRPVARSKKGH
jgi:hypothetical protein